MRRRYSLAILLCCYGYGFSQNQSKSDIEALISKAHSIYRTNIDSALVYSSEAYTLSLQARDTSLIAISIFYKSLCLIGKEEFEEAEDLLQFNITNKDHISIDILGDSYSNLGAIYSQTHQRDKALTVYFNALEVFSDANNAGGLAKTNLNIGVIYDHLGKTELAAYFFEQSKFYSLRTATSSDVHDLTKTDELSNPDLMIEMAIKALNSVENKEDSQLKAILYHALGTIYFKDKKDYKQAILYLEKANKVKEHIQYLNLLDISYYIIGTAHVYNDQYKLGIDNLRKALAVTAQINLKKQIYESLILAYESQGNFRVALGVSKELTEINDSIDKHRENDRIAEITAQFETEKQAKEIELLESDNQLQASQLRNQKNIIFTTVGGGLLLLTVLFFAYKNHRIKRNLQFSELTQKLLQMQLNPHFLFNALNGIQYFIKKNDVKKSTKYISSFSGLMRNILENSVEKFISINEDYKTIDDFLALQQLVHNNSFEYEISLDDALDPENMCIPPMFTQPFVENAIIHGVSGMSKGKIDVGYRLTEPTITIEISDNGKGIHIEKKSPNSLHKSMGTSITKQRIENLLKTEKYPIEMEIVSRNEENGQQGTKIVLSFPIKYR
ncbi:MAG: histidine kinase [Bacteroidetes bacterium]|nr:histidine kinase [Bacteroidota bacterium]